MTRTPITLLGGLAVGAGVATGMGITVVVGEGSDDVSVGSTDGGSCEPVVIVLLVAMDIDGGILEISSAQLLLVGPVYIEEIFVYIR